MEQTVFYVVGIALVVAALGVSALGLRNRSFPPTRAALAGGVALFVVLVGATTTASVINARDEQEHRENELAAESAEEQEAAKEEEQAQEAGETDGGQGASELKLSAPADGSLAFEPGSLEATAGEVTIDFQNPASVEHDVHIEQDGEELAASDLVADGESTTATAELEPGEYVFYCAVPGHREGGMEGTLTVD
jgi:plastocyanin